MAPKGREVFGATSAEQSPSIEPFKTTCLVSTSYLLLSSSNYIARALKHTDCRRRWRRLFAIAPSTLHAAKHTMSNYMTLLIHVCATHTGAALRRSISLNKSNPYMQDLVPAALSHDALCSAAGAASTDVLCSTTAAASFARAHLAERHSWRQGFRSLVHMQSFAATRQTRAAAEAHVGERRGAYPLTADAALMALVTNFLLASFGCFRRCNRCPHRWLRVLAGIRGGRIRSKSTCVL